MGDAPTLTEWLRSQGRSLGEPYILQERWYALLPKRVPQGIPVVEGSPVAEGAAADVAPLQAVVVDNQVDAKTVVRNDGRAAARAAARAPPEPRGWVDSRRCCRHGRRRRRQRRRKGKERLTARERLRQGARTPACGRRHKGPPPGVGWAPRVGPTSGRRPMSVRQEQPQQLAGAILPIGRPGRRAHRVARRGQLLRRRRARPPAQARRRRLDQGVAQRALPAEGARHVGAQPGGAPQHLPAGVSPPPGRLSPNRSQPATTATATTDPPEPVLSRPTQLGCRRTARVRVRRQKKFTSLDGSAESMGDLKSIVLHDMKITHVKSNFPVALGKSCLPQPSPR